MIKRERKFKILKNLKKKWEEVLRIEMNKRERREWIGKEWIEWEEEEIRNKIIYEMGELG